MAQQQLELVPEYSAFDHFAPEIKARALIFTAAHSPEALPQIMANILTWPIKDYSNLLKIYKTNTPNPNVRFISTLLTRSSVAQALIDDFLAYASSVVLENIPQRCEEVIFLYAHYGFAKNLLMGATKIACNDANKRGFYSHFIKVLKQQNLLKNTDFTEVFVNLLKDSVVAKQTKCSKGCCLTDHFYIPVSTFRRLQLCIDVLIEIGEADIAASWDYILGSKHYAMSFLSWVYGINGDGDRDGDGYIQMGDIDYIKKYILLCAKNPKYSKNDFEKGFPYYGSIKWYEDIIKTTAEGMLQAELNQGRAMYEKLPLLSISQIQALATTDEGLGEAMLAYLNQFAVGISDEEKAGFEALRLKLDTFFSIGTGLNPLSSANKAQSEYKKISQMITPKPAKADVMDSFLSFFGKKPKPDKELRIMPQASSAAAAAVLEEDLQSLFTKNNN